MRFISCRRRNRVEGETPHPGPLQGLEFERLAWRYGHDRIRATRMRIEALLRRGEESINKYPFFPVNEMKGMCTRRKVERRRIAIILAPIWIWSVTTTYSEPCPLLPLLKGNVPAKWKVN